MTDVTRPADLQLHVGSTLGFVAGVTPHLVSV